MKKMTTWEKILDIAALLTILFSIVFKFLYGVKDTDTLVILAFVGILLFVIFLVASFFPVDWRMTEKQKARIKDMEVYQVKYRKIMVIITFIFSIFSTSLIIICVQ